MVSSTHMDNGQLVTDLRLSTVVPARMTPENTVHHLTHMDLAMKLHYLRALYFFDAESVQGISTFDLKKAMFPLLNVYCQAAGRIRRETVEDGGRPLIKCNDSGVRIVEAQAAKTLEEWVADQMDGDNCALDDYLIYNQVLGPDLGFSPLVFVQLTWFKCGGLSLGLSWAHVLGDAFSASHFINVWAQIVSGHEPTQPLSSSISGNKFQFPSPIPQKPLSIKRVDPVDNYWVVPNNRKLETHSIHVTAKQLNQFLPEASNGNTFQALTAMIWKSLAKIRAESSDLKIMTICTSNSKGREKGTLSNAQLISTVQADFVVSEADAMELVKLIKEKSSDERGMIEELMEKEKEKSDFIVYGANLTFVNLEDVPIHDAKLNGKKAIFANYSMIGVGDEGVILILSDPRNGNGESGSGQMVTMVLPEGEGQKLKNELKRGWGTF